MKSRRSPTYPEPLTCERCGEAAVKTSAMQRYCKPCSGIRARERGLKRYHEFSPKPARKINYQVRAAKGARLSALEKPDVASVFKEPVLLWEVHAAFPFSWAASKNFVFSPSGEHLERRKEKNAYRALAVEAVSKSLAGVCVAQNKLWISIFVEKANNKGDAVNVIDLVCDIIKEAVGLDDRWFSIRRVDWRISKVDPQVFVSVGQDSHEHVQACSFCGRLLPLADFQRNKGSPVGVSRNCRECCRVEDKARRPVGSQSKLAKSQV